MARGYTVTLESVMPQVVKEIEAASQRALLAATMEWHNAVIKLLRGPRSGYVYPVPGTGKVVDAEKTLANGRTFYYRKLEGARYYTASAPGEAPAVRLGDLRTSYRYIVEGNNGIIGTPLHYAVYLEKGTSEMAPRPHLERGYVENAKAIKDHLAGPWL
jgi:hypothetical protein